MNIPEWVKEGQRMVMRRSGFGRSTYGEVRMITKVYKNGNFILEGSTQQWRPWGTSASKTGQADRWSRDSCVPYTDEIREEVLRHQAIDRAKAAIRLEAERLDKLWRGGSDDEILAGVQILSKVEGLAP